MLSAVWFLTFNCNLQCPYCWERQAQKHGECEPLPFIDAEKWVEAWNRINPNILDITGGEPFMQPGFIEMVSKISSQIAITTNLSHDLTRFVQEISPDKVFSMTVSWHPTGMMSIDRFLGKCLLLKNRGFRLTVNFVTYPEQLWLIDHYRNIFASWKLDFHVDPYIQTKYYPFMLSDNEREFVRRYTGSDRQEITPRPVLCSAGVDHLTVFPDGTAYRCINNKLDGIDQIGNILDQEFKLLSQEYQCAVYHKCAGCNRDKVKVKDV